MACDCIPDPNNIDQIEESRHNYWEHQLRYDDRQYFPDPRDSYDLDYEYCQDDEAYGYSPSVLCDSRSIAEEPSQPREEKNEEERPEPKEEKINYEARGRTYQGDIGEWAIGNEAVKEFNLIPVCFDKSEHGYDGVYSDRQGNLVILESKFTEKSGISALGTPSYGKEGSVEWVTHIAKEMCNPESKEFYSPDNAKIGETILRLGAENVKFLLGHLDPCPDIKDNKFFVPDFKWLR